MSAVHKYYRKITENVDNIKDNMEIASLLIKSQEVDLKFDEIKENLNLIDTIKDDIDKNKNEIYKKGLLITANNSKIYAHKKRLDVIEEDIKNIPLNSTEIIVIKTNVTNLKNNVENDIVTINSTLTDILYMKTTLDNVKYRQSAINMILDRLIPLQDIVKNNTTNITNNYYISEIHKKKSEFNTGLIDVHTNNIKTINSTLSNIKNDIDVINSNTYTPVSDQNMY